MLPDKLTSVYTSLPLIAAGVIALFLYYTRKYTKPGPLWLGVGFALLVAVVLIYTLPAY